MIDHIRVERTENCSFINCKRKGAFILVEKRAFGDLAWYPECRKHFIETRDMRNWSEEAKQQWKEIVLKGE